MSLLVNPQKSIFTVINRSLPGVFFPTLANDIGEPAVIKAWGVQGKKYWIQVHKFWHGG